MILIIDNYDSFTYNLYQYVAEVRGCEEELVVKRNDKISLEEIEALNPSHIILSPGPCTPNEAGICVDLVRTFAGKIPILGICLGHQAIGQAFGAKIVKAPLPVHGKTTTVKNEGHFLFANLPNEFQVGRYHSLVVCGETLPENLRATAYSAEGVVMAIEHKNLRKVLGLQFHPESILTEQGKNILANFFR